MPDTGDMTLEELYDHANRLCRKHWAIEYTGKIELVNRDWKRRLGYFTAYNDGTTALRFSRKVNAKMPRSDVLDALLHELVHWYLFTQGLPFGDGDEEFVKEALRVGAPISGTREAQRAAYQYKKYTEES
ncbi:hypothetical protein ABND12_20070 [Paenibacillus larvae]